MKAARCRSELALPTKRALMPREGGGERGKGEREEQREREREAAAGALPGQQHPSAVEAAVTLIVTRVAIVTRPGSLTRVADPDPDPGRARGVVRGRAGPRDPDPSHHDPRRGPEGSG